MRRIIQRLMAWWRNWRQPTYYIYIVAEGEPTWDETDGLIFEIVIYDESEVE